MQMGDRQLDPAADELLQLTAALCDGTATAEARDRLEQMLRGNDDAKRLYLEYVSIHSRLCWPMRAAEAVTEHFHEATFESIAAEARAEQPASKEESRERKADDERLKEMSTPSPRSKSWLNRASSRPGWPSIAVAVALAVMVVGLGWAAVTYLPELVAGGGGKDAETRQPEAEAEFVAWYMGARDAEWLDDTEPQKTKLMPGQRLAIAKGLIEIQYRTRAVVVIEGPAEFYVGGQESAARSQEKEANRGYLKLGSLVARVEGEKAKGFAVETPNARIEDLGTEFAVSVDERETVTTHVIQGSVEVHRGNESDTLFAGDFATIADGDVVLGKTDKAQLDRQFAHFLRALPTPSQRKTLNINWAGNHPAQDRSPLFAAGAADGGRVGLWNQLSTLAEGHSQGFRRLFYGNRLLASGLAVEFVTPVNSWEPKSGAGDLAIFSGHINTKPNGASCRIKITGLNRVSKYDLYLYAARRSDPLHTEFMVGGMTKKVAPSSETSRLVEGTNYVVFRDVESDAEGGIEIAFSSERGGHFNALQLIEKEPPDQTPENEKTIPQN